MSGDDIKVNRMVITTTHGGSIQYIKKNEEGDFILAGNIKGAHLFTYKEALKFIKMAQPNVPSQLIPQAVK